MKDLIDYHIHTAHSGDGQTPLNDMIEAAIQKGCDEICITSHYDALYPLWPDEDYEPDLLAYYRDVSKVAEQYKRQITVRAGVELGLQAWRQDVLDKTKRAIEGIPFDFFIGSLHCLSPQPVVDEAAYWQNHTRASFVSMMLEHQLAIAREYDCFDVMGHLTYFSRYCPFGDKQQRYTDAPELWDALFQTLIERGKGIEINTSTKGKLGFFMPELELVRRYHELGGKIVTIGSDAHVPSAVARHEKEAKEMLAEAGFDCLCTFERHVPSFVNL